MAMEPDAEDEEREEAYKAAKSIAVQTYTACGRDADWDAQAEHFVASACSAALTPDALITEKQNLAWKAAIQARMAKNCMMIGSGEGEVDNEAVIQYEIAEEVHRRLTRYSVNPPSKLWLCYNHMIRGFSLRSWCG